MSVQHLTPCSKRMTFSSSLEDVDVDKGELVRPKLQTELWLADAALTQMQADLLMQTCKSSSKRTLYLLSF